MNPRSNRYRRPATSWLAPALATVLGLTAGSTQAGGHHKRVVLVPVETVSPVAAPAPATTTRVIYREILRSPQAPAPTKDVAPAPSPATPQTRDVPREAAAEPDDSPATRTVVVERYVYRDAEPATVREVAPVAVRAVRVRTVRAVPVQTYVVREVAPATAPTYVVVRPKHHLFGH